MHLELRSVQVGVGAKESTPGDKNGDLTSSGDSLGTMSSKDALGSDGGKLPVVLGLV